MYHEILNLFMRIKKANVVLRDLEFYLSALIIGSREISCEFYNILTSASTCSNSISTDIRSMHVNIFLCVWGMIFKENIASALHL